MSGAQRGGGRSPVHDSGHSVSFTREVRKTRNGLRNSRTRGTGLNDDITNIVSNKQLCASLVFTVFFVDDKCFFYLCDEGREEGRQGGAVQARPWLESTTRFQYLIAKGISVLSTCFLSLRH